MVCEQALRPVVLGDRHPGHDCRHPTIPVERLHADGPLLREEAHGPQDQEGAFLSGHEQVYLILTNDGFRRTSDEQGVVRCALDTRPR